MFAQTITTLVSKKWGFLGGSVVESTCQRRTLGFDLWIRKIPLEEEMATHSSILAWETLQTVEPGWLQSMGSQSQTQLSTLHHYKKEKQTLQTVGPPSAGQSTLLDCFPVHVNEDNRGPGKLDNIPSIIDSTHSTPSVGILSLQTPKLPIFIISQSFSHFPTSYWSIPPPLLVPQL